MMHSGFEPENRFKSSIEDAHPQPVSPATTKLVPLHQVFGATVLDKILILALLCFSFVVTFAAGERGFFAFDQSIVFDGSYRILQGQIPYKDFLIPIGPVVFWIQAAFFKIFGISYFSYILGAASGNVLATVCSIIIIRLLFPPGKALSYLSGLLTAIWFYPPFGTPWMEQTAFLISLLGLTALLIAIDQAGQRKSAVILLIMLSGLLAFVSVLSKQNVGVFVLPLSLLIMASTSQDRRQLSGKCIFFAIGFMGGIFLFWAWLRTVSDTDNFIRCFFDIPAELGKRRIIGHLPVLLKSALAGIGPAPVRVITCGSTVASLIACLMLLKKPGIMKQFARLLPATFLCLYLVMFQYLFIQTTYNQRENAFPFLGLIFACGVGLLIIGLKSWDIAPSRSRTPAAAVLLAGVAGLTVAASITGIGISLRRDVHDIFEKSRFPAYSKIEKLKYLRWGVPTEIGGQDITEGDVDALLSHLRARGGNFFVFRDFTILYGLLNVPSPQPLLWFHRGLTYPADYDAELDKNIVEALERNNVEIIILEEKRFLAIISSLKDFPRLESYIKGEFAETTMIGNFRILEKRGNGLALQDVSG